MNMEMDAEDMDDETASDISHHLSGDDTDDLVMELESLVVRAETADRNMDAPSTERSDFSELSKASGRLGDDILVGLQTYEPTEPIPSHDQALVEGDYYPALHGTIFVLDIGLFDPCAINRYVLPGDTCMDNWMEDIISDWGGKVITPETFAATFHPRYHYYLLLPSERDAVSVKAARQLARFPPRHRAHNGGLIGFTGVRWSAWVWELAPDEGQTIDELADPRFGCPS